MGQMFAKAKNEDEMVRPLQPNMHVGRGLQLKAVSVCPSRYTPYLRPAGCNVAAVIYTIAVVNIYMIAGGRAKEKTILRSRACTGITDMHRGVQVLRWQGRYRRQKYAQRGSGPALARQVQATKAAGSTATQAAHAREAGVGPYGVPYSKGWFRLSVFSAYDT